MNKDKLIKFLKEFYLLIVIMLLILIFISLFKDNDKPFLKTGWVTHEDPKFYYYFYKNDRGYTVKTYDKFHDLLSVNDTGALDKSTLTFIDTDGSTDIYTYKNNLIYIFDISTRGIKTEFYPLERIEDE
jgi:hypothetical protein